MALIAADGTVCHLNPTGAAILAYLTTGGIECAVTTLIGRYGITEEQARSDVSALVEDMQRRQLLSSPRAGSTEPWPTERSEEER